MHGLAIYFLVVLLIQAFSITMLILNYRLIPKLAPGVYKSPVDSAPLVTVIVPARNEEANIERCVLSLLSQDYPNFELIVVNDRSSDSTGEILERLAKRDERLRVIHGVEPPAGWMGKNHAIYQGVARAKGDYLLFVDADLQLERECLTQAVGFAMERGSDLLTLLPKLINRTFWERVVQPSIGQLVLTWFPAGLINDPRRKKVASANGPFMMFNRKAYEQIGGHEAVKGDIVEDLALARMIKQSDHRLSYVLGIDLARLRMYTSLKEIWNGWSKNFYVGVGGNAVGAIIAMIGMFALFLLPWLLGPAALIIWASGAQSAGWTAAGALAVLLSAVLWRRIQDALYRGEAHTAWLQALGFSVVLGILANSTFLALTGRKVGWKGREQKIEIR